ncbi:MAG: VanZ family protein [Planctomycetales bacterium]|nr:VanZ family protein [Planctomycetales bacterium]
MLCLVVTGCRRAPTPAQFERQIPWAGRGEWVKFDPQLHADFGTGQHSLKEVLNRAQDQRCQVVGFADDAVPDETELEQLTGASLPQVLPGIQWQASDKDSPQIALLSPRRDNWQLAMEFRNQFHLSNQTVASASEWLRQRDRQSVLISTELAPQEPATTRTISVEPNQDQLAVTPAALREQPKQPRLFLGSGGGQQAWSSDSRWSPAMQIGAEWDRQLQAGELVWGALASSQFSDSKQDYWPGEFSATWAYARDSSATGVLEALHAGSFFGAHGGIVEQLRMMVDAPGLQRSAEVGETIRVNAGTSVTVVVRFEIPKTDWTGQPNRVDEVELIGVFPDGARSLAKHQPSEMGSALGAVVKIPTGGATLRMRGARIAGDGSRWECYSNPIRINADLARGIGLLGIFPALLWIFAPAVVLVVPLAWLDMFRNLTPSHQQHQQQQLIWPRNTHYTGLAAMAALVAAYVLIFPLDFRSLPLPAALSRFAAAPLQQVSITGRADLVANAILFFPLAYCLVAALTVDRPSPMLRMWASLGVLLSCCLLSFTLEFLQLWRPGTAPSQNAILAQTAGAAMGVLAWLVFGPWLTRWLRGLVSELRPRHRFQWVLEFYGIAFVLAALLPLDVTVSISDLVTKHDEGRLLLAREPIWQNLAQLLAFIPLGALIAIWRMGRHGKSRSMILVGSLGLLFAAMLELAQVFVFSRTAVLIDVAMGSLGAIAGGLAMKLARGASPARQPSSNALQHGLAAAAIVATISLVVFYGWPFSPVQDEAAVAARYSSFTLYRAGDEPTVVVSAQPVRPGLETSLAHLLLLSCPFFVVGWLWAAVAGQIATKQRRQLLLAVVVVVLALFSLAIESMQVLVATDHPRLTDSATYFLSALGGLFVGLRLHSARQRIATQTALAEGDDYLEAEEVEGYLRPE